MGRSQRPRRQSHISRLGRYFSRELGEGDRGRRLRRGLARPFALGCELGDDQRRSPSTAESILRSPVVLGLRKRSIADSGWAGSGGMTSRMDDIQKAAARDGEFRLSMTSATQSNSGASAYFGFLYALRGRAGRADARITLRAIRRCARTKSRDAAAARWIGPRGPRAGSRTRWSRTPIAFDAMINYEALIIEANQRVRPRTGGENRST